MAKRITRIEPWQTAKTLAALYFVLGLLGAVLLFLIPGSAFNAAGEEKPGIGLFLAMPVIYAVAALIFVPIACWIYNLVASKLGGIEITITDTST